MKVNLVSKAYIENQKKILDLQHTWVKSVEKVYSPTLMGSYTPGIPLMMQLEVEVDPQQYGQSVKELMELLTTFNQSLQPQVERITKTLTDKTLDRWIIEAMGFNQYYFESFAEEYNLDPWLPYYLAEQAIRPYLQVIANQFKEQIANSDAKRDCPCCGEPIRLAILKDKGKKVLQCPRCYAQWDEKRTSCSHCGEENDDASYYLTVEESKNEQVQVCKTCKGYVKVIDLRSSFKQHEPALLDLQSIHLDFIAQKQGYGIIDIKETNKN